jgi:hypothetical protein
MLRNKIKNNTKISASEINQFVYSPKLWYKKRTRKKSKVLNKNCKSEKNDKLRKVFRRGNRFHKYFLLKYNLFLILKRLFILILFVFVFYLLHFYIKF